MVLRLSKILMVLAMALLTSLSAFGNITDYGTNFAFVHHVMLMDTIFPDSGIKYRAISAPWLHHAAYVLIIVLETATAALCWAGALRLWRARHKDHSAFQHAKNTAVTGLTLGFLTWQVAFMSIGGEWFGMWMSQEWNGTSSAFRFFVTLLLVLMFLSMRNDDLENREL